MIAATPAHAAAMAAIHQAAFGPDGWGEASFATLLAQPGVTGLIDERGGVLLLRGVADEAEILTIGVARTRQGIGRALLQAALATARNAGATTLYLEVAAQNAAARALYTAFGFQPASLRKNYYPDGDDALLLRKILE